MNGRRFDLACLDLAGTTVADGGLVESAFDAALDAVGVGEGDPRRPGMVAHVRRTMGRSKIEVFSELFEGPGEASRANAAFEEAYGRLLDAGAAHPLPGAEAAMDRLQAAGVSVALTTGFSPATRDRLLRALGWEHRAALVLSPADAGRGRPWPDMILLAARRLSVDDLHRVAVAGDTGADMEAGRRAGAGVVAGVLTGADDRAALVAAGATVVLGSVADLPDVLGVPA